MLPKPFALRMVYFIYLGNLFFGGWVGVGHKPFTVFYETRTSGLRNLFPCSVFTAFAI